MLASRFLFVVGASGTGKTASTARLARRALPDIVCHHFDSIGIPSIDEMTREHGGPQEWQAAVTREWVDRLARANDERIMILEGQTRPSFIRDAIARHAIGAAGILLLDCDPAVRRQRLCSDRGQPELDTDEMSNWAAYLRGQADALGLLVVDTTSASLGHVADQICERARMVR